MGMDSELITRISSEHRRRLAWFEEHQGEVSASPGPLPGGLLLVSKPKRIYKPGDLPYALSIKINLDSPYEDGVPVPTPGGGWLLSYHQENADPAARDTVFTNRGLMRCIADRVPVGVLRERAPAGRRSQYDVLGLAMPVRWEDGRFFFESLNPKAVPVIDPVSDVLEAPSPLAEEPSSQAATEPRAERNLDVERPSGSTQLASPSPKGRVNFWRRSLPTPIYVLVLVAALLIQSWWIPTWLVSSRTGLQTLVQDLPPVVIALFALGFATLFVAVQQVTNVFSNRAPLILVSDVRVRRIVAQTVIIAASSLFLGAVISDSPKPLSAYMTAAGTTLLMASIYLIYSYGLFASLLIVEYGAPRAFVKNVLIPVFAMIQQNKIKTGLVLFRVPLLGQTLRYALRRDDAETVYASLEGLQTLQKIYVEATLKQPALRSHKITETNIREGWLADELYRTYVGACEEALRLQSPQLEIDEIVDYFADATFTFIKAHQEAESKQLLTGLAQVTTTPYQVTAGATNHLSRPASSLASAERCAEEEGQLTLASYALANWAVAIAYPQIHFGQNYHPLFEEGVHRFGDHPPWEEAIAISRSSSWSAQWANQLQGRIGFTTETLELARDLHEGPDGPNYRIRRRAVYANWLMVTRNVATHIMPNWQEFTQILGNSRRTLSMFGSETVKAGVDSYSTILTETITNLFDILQSSKVEVDPEEVRRLVSDALGNEHLTMAREAVLEAMRQEVGEDLQ
jgi:hypothetical protein